MTHHRARRRARQRGHRPATAQALESRQMLSAVAGDGFESGDFNSGTDQWASGGWNVSGDAALQSSGAHDGTYHVRLRRDSGDLQRSVDVSGFSDVTLQFWSRVSSFEGSDQAHVRVSGDGVNWTTLQTFSNGDDDNQYHFHELAVPDLGDTLHIHFDADMSTANDNWYLDDIAVLGEPVVTVPAISVGDAELVEGDSGTSSMVFTVTRSGDTSGTSSVDFTTVDGTAQAGSDYVATSGTLQFLAGETSQTISVTINGDAAIEPDEAFSVQLSNPINATIDDGTAAGTITDDDVTPTISYSDFSDSTGLTLVGDAAIAEGDILRLTPAVGGQAGAAWYSGEQQFVSVAWETTFDFNLNDNFDSPGGSGGFVFAIQNYDPTYLRGGGGTFGYLDLPNSVVVEFDTYQDVDAGDPSHSHISVHTNGTGPNGWDESLSLGSYDTPTIMDDAQTHTARIRYTPGQLSIYLDDLTTPVLTVDVDLAQTLDLDGGRAWVGFTAATGGGWQNHDILNWDYRVLEDTSTTLAIHNTSVIEGNAGTTQMAFEVTRAGDTSGTVTLDWTTANGTAVAGSDYTAASGQLTFNPGETSKTIFVAVNGDTIEELHETLSVILSNVSGALLITPSGTGTILNDDVSISISDATATEGDSSLVHIDNFVDAGLPGRFRNLRVGPDANADGRDDLYVVNPDTKEILIFDSLSGQFLDVFVESGSGGLDDPLDLRFGPDGDLYVTSRGTNANPDNNAIYKFDGTTGELIGGGPFVTGLQQAFSFDFGDDGHLYVVNRATNSIEKFDGATGQSLGVFVSNAAGTTGELRMATFGVDLTGDDVSELYVANNLNREILRYNGATGALLDTVTIPSTHGNLAWVEVADDGTIYATTRPMNGFTTILQIDGSTGIIASAVTLSRDAWSLEVSPEEIIYVGGNAAGTMIDRLGPASLARVEVSLSAASGEVVEVDFSTLDGTALGGLDFAAVSGTLTFAPGETSKTLLIPMLDDPDIESNEMFFVNLSNASGATVADSQGEVTILDNDTPPPAFVDNYAVSESTSQGSITSGSLADTQASDNIYEAMRETETGGRPSNRTTLLEHTWTFDVTGGDTVTFFVEAWHTANGEGDDFLFAYSTDGTKFTDMLTVTKTADDDAAQSYVLPAGISGTVYIRVTDTDQTQGNRTLDTLYVDQMFVRSESSAAGMMANLLEEDEEGPTFSV